MGASEVIQDGGPEQVKAIRSINLSLKIEGVHGHPDRTTFPVVPCNKDPRSEPCVAAQVRSAHCLMIISTVIRATVSIIIRYWSDLWRRIPLALACCYPRAHVSSVDMQ